MFAQSVWKNPGDPPELGGQAVWVPRNDAPNGRKPDSPIPFLKLATVAKHGRHLNAFRLLGRHYLLIERLF